MMDRFDLLLKGFVRMGMQTDRGGESVVVLGVAQGARDSY